VNIDYRSFFLGAVAISAAAAVVTPVWRNFRHRCVCGGKTEKEVVCHRLRDIDGQARVRVFSFRICKKTDCELVSVGGGVKSYSQRRARKLNYNTGRITELCRRAGVPGIIEGVTVY
jgi:hypothetical protein